MTPEEAAIIRGIESSTRRLAATAERLCTTRPAEPRTTPIAAPSSAPRVSSSPATASPAPAATPAPTLSPRAGAPDLLDHLAARMAAPDSSPTLNTRARDAPQAA